MWCQACRQDVPAIAAGEEGRLCCARCGEAIASVLLVAHAEQIADTGIDLSGEASDRAERSTGESIERPADLDHGALEEAARILKPESAQRFDAPHAPHAALAGPHFNMKPHHAPHPEPQADGRLERPRRKRGTSLLAWLLLALGLMAFSCGAVLLGWSIYAGRADLWNLGVPLTLAGQFLLILGLVLNLDRLWKTNDENLTKLDEVEQRLVDLRNTTMLLGPGRGSASQNFYWHVAEGASPQILLSDLKGQLDMLAVEISRKR